MPPEPNARLLFVTPTCPRPTGSGSQQRAFRHLQALAALGSVDLLLINPNEVEQDAAAKETLALVERFVVTPAPEAYRARMKRYLASKSKLQSISRALFDVAPIAHAPLSREEQDTHALFLPSRSYDLAFCFKLHAGRWLDVMRARHALQFGSTVVDFDDIESRVAMRELRTDWKQLSVLWRAVVVKRSVLLRRVERRLLHAFDQVLCCSSTDRQILHRRGGQAVAVVPNSIQMPISEAPTTTRGDVSTLLFVGLLSYGPNTDAIRHFVRECWPALRQRFGGSIRFEIVGREPTDEIMALHGVDGITVCASVPDLVPHYANAQVCIVPIRYGGGTRIKILEALAHRRAVVSTTLGAEGLDLVPGEHLLIADTPEAIVDAIERAVRDAELARSLGDAGNRRVQALYAHTVVARRLQNLMSPLLDLTKTVPVPVPETAPAPPRMPVVDSRSDGVATSEPKSGMLSVQTSDEKVSA